jgi:uncharacterized protein (TIGR02757 family)
MTQHSDLGDGLARLYRKFNRRAYVHPDPLEIVYRFDQPRDQEIAGLISACLAYGRVAQILVSVSRVLDGLMGGAFGGPGGPGGPGAIGGPGAPGGRASGPLVSPRAALERASEAELRRAFSGFRHRFTSGAEIAALLIAMRRAISRHGSLEALFAQGVHEEDGNFIPGLTRFVDSLRRFAGGSAACASLLSSPSDGSACKRLNLYLRWMVRRDAVDPGPWSSLPAAKLVIPLDTHMFRISRALGLTVRSGATLKAAMEITAGFARFSPRDPVRYDFCLTRLGINPACTDEDFECLLRDGGPTAIPSAPGHGQKRT